MGGARWRLCLHSLTHQSIMKFNFVIIYYYSAERVVVVRRRRPGNNNNNIPSHTHTHIHDERASSFPPLNLGKTQIWKEIP